MNKLTKRIDLNNYYKVGDVVMIAPDNCYWTRDAYDDQLFKVVKVGKTKAVVMPLQCETNVDEALHNSNGASTAWYRKYKKEYLTSNSATEYYNCKCKVSARELGISSFRGEIQDCTNLYKFYDAASDRIVMKKYANCDEIVIINEKHW